MEDVWATGRRHVKISKLYLKALLRQGPNIFVALAWSQVFWLILESAAGNEDSRGYVRLPTVALYALALHAGGHLLLFHYHRRRLSPHAMEFLVDLATDVVGFAWIALAEEMLAQVFLVTAGNAFMYAALALAASLGAMEIGSFVRRLLDWPPEFDGTANDFDAGCFALPTSWLVTQAVHIALYGFFYRTSVAGGQGGRGKMGEEVDIRPAASLFLFVYAMLCSAVAARVIGGTVAAAAVVDDRGGSMHGIDGDGGGWAQGRGARDVERSDLVIRAVGAGGPFRAALASDLVSPSAHRGRRRDQELPKLELDLEALPDGAGGTDDTGTQRAATGDTRARSSLNGNDLETSGEYGGGGADRLDNPPEARLETPPTSFADAARAVEVGRARHESLRRGIKAYMRITVGMIVGWGYNMWAQLVFRQEELEFRFGPAMGATVYAALSTVLGVCVMVRGADWIDSQGVDDAVPGRDVADDDGRLSIGYGVASRRRDEEQKRRRIALRAFHAKRMLVVVGGVSLMVGWAWEEAFDLMLETLVGDSADAGAIAAKLALAAISTAAVLWAELRARHDGDDHHLGKGSAGGRPCGDRGGGLLDEVVGGSGEEDADGEGLAVENKLLVPLITNTERDGIQ